LDGPDLDVADIQCPGACRLHSSLPDRARYGAETFVFKANYFDLGKRYLRQAWKRAGIGSRSFDTRRATASTLLKEWGVGDSLFRAAIGHDDQVVADKHYDAIDVARARPSATWDRERGENMMDLFDRFCRAPK
jgi:hypothetical protein